MKNTEVVPAKEILTDISPKVMAKRAKELGKRIAQKNKSPLKYYFIILVVILAIISVVDETATQIGGSIQSNVVTEFFVNGMGLSYNEGLSRMSFLGIISLLIAMLSPIYKTLADKWGRKPLLVMSTIGFTVGMSICFLARDFMTYIIGASILSFFISHDMQVTYILETAPKDKRTFFYGLTKSIGEIGMILLPLVRNIFMGNDATKWRMIYVVPGLIGLAVAIIMMVFGRETDTFLNQRIKHLEAPPAPKTKKAKSGEKSGIGVGFKYLFKHKVLRWLAISGIFSGLSMIPIVAFYQSVMFTSGMSTEDITLSLFFYPFVYAGLVLLCGYLGDKIGRKKIIAACAAIFIGSFVLFIVGCKSGWSPVAIGIFYAVYLSSYWQMNDYRGIMVNELTPTRIRYSVTGANGILTFIAVVLGQIVSSAAVAIFDIGYFCLIFGIPIAFIGTMIFLLKAPETKNVDLDEVEEVQFT